MRRALRNVGILVAVTVAAAGVIFVVPIVISVYILPPQHVEPPVFIRVKITITVTPSGSGVRARH